MANRGKKGRRYKSRIDRHARPKTTIVQSRIDSTSTDHLAPIFDFSQMRPKYCITKCEDKEKSQFINSIIKYSKISWQKIKTNQRHKGGLEKISLNAICGDSTNFLTPDTNLLALRVIGKAPMIGFRSGQTFKIIWVDNKFTLYKH